MKAANRYKLIVLILGIVFSNNAIIAQDNIHVAPGTGVGFFQDTTNIWGRMTVDQGNLFFQPNARVFYYGDTLRLTPGSSVSGGKFIFRSPRIYPTAAFFTQYLDGGGTKLGSIDIDNSLDLHLANTAGGAADTLRFIQGMLYLHENNFVLGNTSGPGVIANYSPNNFVVTGAPLSASSGFLSRENIGSTMAVFPIGPTNVNYEPGAIENTGVADRFGMRVAPLVYEFVSTGSLQNGRSSQMTWFVNEGTAGGSNVKLTLQHDTMHEGVNFKQNRMHHFISRYVGFAPNFEGDTLSTTNWDNIQLANTQVGTLGGTLTTGATIPGQLMSTRDNLTYFGPFAKTTWSKPYMIQVLPIEFLGISANWKTEDVGTVNWVVNNDYEAIRYSVEHALPGAKKFSEIGIVQSKKLMGTVKYSFDENLTGVSGTVFYRIKAYSMDGKTSQSSVVSLSKLNNGATVIMGPNPSSTFVDIMTVGSVNTDDAMEVKLYNAAGEFIYEGSDPTGQKLHINTSAWSEGVYVVKIRIGTYYQTEKLVITR